MPPRILSGIKPTGDLHLGNYIGALRNWVAMQKDFECLFCVVDLHAITDWQDPKELRRATREVAAGMIASGTVGGAFDGSFDATASLEIFQMDLSSKTGQMEMLGSEQTPERFHRLAWGSFGSNCSSLPLGMLAGGMVDGTVKVFDPAVLAR